MWSWDITKLRGPVKWTYYHLYCIIDIYSRYIVGWMVASRESAELAERLFTDTITKQGIDRGRLTIHADNGSSMASETGRVPARRPRGDQVPLRPHVSNDNPYSKPISKAEIPPRQFPDRIRQPRRRPRLPGPGSSPGTTMLTGTPGSACTPRRRPPRPRRHHPPTTSHRPQPGLHRAPRTV
ncbi:MAG: transposase family protein [Propionibacteriaceae bacterium]|nr:transposase family protein [Propionibacteriaceae bacterium]